MRVPHPHDGFIIVRLGIRVANAFFHQPHNPRRRINYPLPMSLRDLSLNLQRRTLEALQTLAPKSTLPPHLQTGLRGEQAALFHLRRLGFTIVAQRWISPHIKGDLDFVAWDGPTLVIFEIKTRTARDFAPADASVDTNKKRQLRLMAGAYLRQLPREHRDRVPIRFDLLSVYLLPTGEEFEYFPDAFSRTSKSRVSGV
jgi:putative endonuclease